jgi:ATP-binding cassette, subfamily B, bacterial PglK
MMIRKLASLFTKKEKNKAILIFLFVVVGAGLEVASLALFSVFIGLLIDVDPEIYNWIMENSIIELNAKNKTELMQIFGVMTGLLFVFKNIYLLLVNYILHKFIYKKYTQVSTQLLKKYIEMPYINHLQTNSAFLQRNINTEVFWLFANIMVPGITLLTELVIVSTIMLALFYVEPINTLILLCGFGGILFFIMVFIKRKMDSLGLISQSHFGEMIKSVNQSIGSVKLTKVTGAAQYFLDHYQSNIDKYSNNTASLKNISQWPRYFVETALIIGIVLASLVIVQNDSSLIINLPIIGFFGMAAIRLMPSFNRITSAYTNIRYYSASLDVVFNELDDTNNTKRSVNINQDSNIIFNQSIEFRNVNFMYPGAIKNSINNLSFKIKKGGSVALIGESGSGKTTIVDLICGLLEPSTGDITTDGKNIFNNLHEWRKIISYVPQDIYLLDDSLRNNIAYGKKSKDIDDELIVHASKLAMLDDYINELEFGYETVIGENGVKMSGGQRQRLGIARALYHNPKILILDEGTAALDNKSQEYVINSINAMASDITVITVAHRLNTVKNSDLILLIEKGSVKKEIPKDMLCELDMDLSKLIS